MGIKLCAYHCICKTRNYISSRGRQIYYCTLRDYFNELNTCLNCVYYQVQYLFQLYVLKKSGPDLNVRVHNIVPDSTVCIHIIVPDSTVHVHNTVLGQPLMAKR